MYSRLEFNNCFYLLSVLIVFCISSNSSAQSVNEDSLLNQVNKVHDTTKIKIYKKLGTHFEDSVAEKSIAYSTKGLEIARANEWEVYEADFLNRIGVVHDNLSDYPEAMKLYTQALELYEKHNYLLGIAATSTNMAYVNFIRKNYDKALFYFEKALEADKALNYQPGIAMGYSNIGAIQLSQKKYRQAISSYQLSHQMFDELQMPKYVGKTLTNIGEAYFCLNLYDSSRYYYEKSVKIKRETGNQHTLIYSCHGLGQVLMQLGDYEKAMEMLEEALELSRELKKKNEEQTVLKSISEYYSATGDHVAALAYYKQFTQLKDSLFNETKSKQISELEIKYESEKKEKAIQILTQKAEYQKRIQLAIGVLIVLLIITIILGYNRMRLKHNLLIKEKLLEETKLKGELDLRNRELTSFTMNVVQKNELLQSLQHELKKIKDESPNLKSALEMVKSNINLEQDWDSLKIHFEKVHPGFYTKLSKNYPELSQNDLRICSYIKMKLSNKEVARMLNMDAKSVRQSHYRIKKKLGLVKENDLAQFIGSF